MNRRKRLGVIGTFVWDVIHGRDPLSAPVQEWGGITYALSAFDAALPPTDNAPIGCPDRKPGRLAAGVPGVGSPVKK